MCGWEEWPSKRQWDITIPGKVLSQNDLKGNNRGGAGWKYRAERRRFERAFLALADGWLPRGARVYRRALVTRYYGKRCRPYDQANFVGGCKPLIDALKTSGLIYDDSPKYFSGYYLQLPSNCVDSRLELTLEERLEEAHNLQ